MSLNYPSPLPENIIQPPSFANKTRITSTSQHPKTFPNNIQRFIILHLGLLPAVTKESSTKSNHDDDNYNYNNNDDDGLGEDSSLEEICEHILYYFDSSTTERFNFHRHAGSSVGLWREREEDTMTSQDGMHQLDSHQQAKEGTGASSRSSSPSNHEYASHKDYVELTTSTCEGNIDTRPPYYNTNANRPSSQMDTNYQTIRYEEQKAAVNFSGLCRTLYSMPSTVSEFVVGGNQSRDKKKSGRAKEVYLSSCTLVFIPLEEEEADDEKLESHVNGIVAVAQIPRGTTDILKSTDKQIAQDVRQVVKRAHSIFQFTRYGGIHHRLTHYNDGMEYVNKQDMALYPGMTMLYDYHKKMRILQRTCEKIQHNSDYGTNPEYMVSMHNVSSRIQTLKQQRNALLRILPNDCIRKDLSLCYDLLFYERDINVPLQKRQEGGQVIRKKEPPKQVLNMNKLQSEQLQPTTSVPSITMEFISRLSSVLFSKKVSLDNHTFQSCEPHNDNEITLQQTRETCFAFSAFRHGQHIKSSSLYEESSSSSSMLLSEAAPTLLEYMLSFQTEVKHYEIKKSLFVDCVGCTMDWKNYYRSKGRGSFLPPPSSSMISSTDHIVDVFIPEYGLIWMPRIWLPPLASHGKGDRRDTHIILYHNKDVDIIFYLKRSSSNDGSTDEKEENCGIESGESFPSDPNENEEQLYTIVPVLQTIALTCDKLLTN